MVNEVVNTALGLAQYITGALNEVQAVSYLLAVESLTLEHWSTSKLLLPGVSETNRRSKEKTIEDIVHVLKNNVDGIPTYLVGDLSVLPGLSPSAIELVTYSAASMHAVSTLVKNSRSIEAQRSSSVQEVQPANQLQSALADTHEQASTYHIKHTPAINNEQQSTSSDVTANNSSLVPSNGNWPQLAQKLPYKPKEKNQGNRIRNESLKRREFVFGSSASNNTNKKHPLRFVCLGVRSGEDETIESLTAEINRWNCTQDLKVEQVRKSYHSSTFRVQYNIAASLYEKWKDPKSWPARIIATEWKGNPKTPLKPLKERLYTKRIYLGGLPETATKQLILNNMKQIYKDEMETTGGRQASVEKIEVFMNEAGTKRERERKALNPSHRIQRSVCVVLTSHPGQPLDDTTLKLDSYHPDIRRTVRYWRGPIPGSRKDPSIDLVWQ